MTKTYTRRALFNLGLVAVSTTAVAVAAPALARGGPDPWERNNGKKRRKARPGKPENRSR